MPDTIHINIPHPQLINQSRTSLIFLLELQNLPHQLLLPPLIPFFLDIQFLCMAFLHFFYCLKEVIAEEEVFVC